jgi:UPF0716 protein FxsA
VGYLVLAVAAFLAELVSLVLVGSYVGWLWTFGLLAGAVVIGVALLSGRGPATVRDVVRAVTQGRAPGPAIVDGALLAVAGILFITPGFASDAIGLALLLPPVRAGVRKRLKAWVTTRWKLRGTGPLVDGLVDLDPRRDAREVGDDDGVIDVEADEIPDRRRAARRDGRGRSLPS